MKGNAIAGLGEKGREAMENAETKAILAAAVAAAAVAVAVTWYCSSSSYSYAEWKRWWCCCSSASSSSGGGGGSDNESKRWRRLKSLPQSEILSAIGNTPLIEIECLRGARGSSCRIFAKLESRNPGGSVKDRVALRVLQDAVASGAVTPFSGALVTEGTAGSTGVSLALCCRELGLRCHVVMPADAAREKSDAVMAFGGSVERVPPVNFTNRNHFVHVARRRAHAEQEKHDEDKREMSKSSSTRSNGGGGGFFSNQFDNASNFRAHYHGTGAEILKQTAGVVIDAFVCGAGTGGSIAGIGTRLRESNGEMLTVLADPHGSGLFNYVTRGVMYSGVEAEGTRLRNPVDTITEGVGVNRCTANLARANIDAAVRCSDAEAVEMAAFVLKRDGLFIGSSSAVNLVGAVRTAEHLTGIDAQRGNAGRDRVIITLLCDSGDRHKSKFHNADFLANNGLTPHATSLEFLEVSGNSVVGAKR